MALELILGPANAGKVAALYDRYLAHLDGGGEALLVLPTRAAVGRAEAELLARRGVLLDGGLITFDALFADVCRSAGATPPRLEDARRRLLLGRLVAESPLEALAGSARHGRFAGAFGRLVDRLGSALVDPSTFTAAAALDPAAGELAELYERWWLLLDEIGAWDAGRLRIGACDALRSSLHAWGRTRLYVQGFEDLSRAQETLVRLVGQRVGATVTLPYEPGRAAFAALRGTVERLGAEATIVELPPLEGVRPPRLAALERLLYEASPAPPHEDGDPSIVIHEAAGGRAEADLVVAAVCTALRDGVPADRVAVISPRAARAGSDVVDALDAAGVPLHVERQVSVAQTAFGHAFDRLLAFAWERDATRGDLFAYLRSPFAGVSRRRVDFAEGRLRGRGVIAGDAAYKGVVELLDGRPIGAVEALRGEGDRAVTAASVARRMIAAAQGLTARPVAAEAIADVAAARAVIEALAAITGLGASADEVRAAAREARIARREATVGRVVVCDARAARGLDADVVIVLGLDQGGFGRSAGEDAFLPPAQREALGDRLEGADAGDLDRHLLYVVLTRARRRIVLVRRAAADDGQPLEPSSLLPEIERAAGGLQVTARRGLADVAFVVSAAPTARERARAVCRLSTTDLRQAERIARADGTARRLERARSAFRRPTRLRDPQVLQALGAQARFPVTALEKFGDCSSWWFVERHLNPREIDATVDAKLLGTIAHAALQRFFKAIPARFGKEQLEPGDADRAEALVREIVAEVMAGQTLPVDGIDARVAERRLARDLARFVRHEAMHPSPLAATRLEVSFGGANSAPGLKDGLRLGDVSVSGKIDRVDTDPAFSARGLVQDYKTGRTAHGASRLLAEGRLQVPLYVLAARELLGIEPMGGLYRALGSGGSTRGMLNGADADALPPGLAPGDVLAPDDFWSIVEGAREQAIEAAGRIRRGDVDHDPRGGQCPHYCPWSGVCRIPR